MRQFSWSVHLKFFTVEQDLLQEAKEQFSEVGLSMTGHSPQVQHVRPNFLIIQLVYVQGRQLILVFENTQRLKQVKMLLEIRLECPIVLFLLIRLDPPEPENLVLLPLDRDPPTMSIVFRCPRDDFSRPKNPCPLV